MNPDLPNTEAQLKIFNRVYKVWAGTTRPPALWPEVNPGASRRRSEIVQQFAEYAAQSRATVTRCQEAELPQTLIRLFGPERVILPLGLPFAWLPEGLPDGIDTVLDSGQDFCALSGFDAVITGCCVAIAETGTVVLAHGPDQGRRALTLIPDHHVCVVFEHQVVGRMAEAVRALTSSIRAGQPLTWISGPSATSDTALSQAAGVHGPRRLDVVLAQSACVSLGGDHAPDR